MFTDRMHFARTVAWLLSFSMLAMVPMAGIAPAAETANRRKASDLLAQQQKIETTLAALNESSLPGRSISPADIVKKVGKDPQALCEYVRRQIAYEPYRGFLKGELGTLSSGRANSADRSLLLAVMLDAAGVNARLVKGTIAADKQPAHAMPVAVKPTDVVPPREAMKSCGLDVDQFDLAVRAAQLEKQKSLEDLWQRVDRDVQTLSVALEDAKVPLPRNAGEPLTEHWWVRTEAGDLDPTLTQANAKETGAWTVKDIPAAEFHTIVFREVIVAKGKAQTVLDARHRSADLFGKVVTFANLAMDWQQQQQTKKSPSSADVLESLKNNHRFRATICVEDKGTLGKLFDVDGTIVEEDSSRGGPAKGLGGGLGGMFGGGVDEKKPRSTLDECRLEVTLAAPGEKTPLVVTRSLLRKGATAAQKVYDLCTAYQFLVMPEDVSEAIIAQKAAKSFETLGQWLKDCGDKDPLQNGGHRKITRLNGELWGFALARRNELKRLGEMHQTIFVHERPTLVASFSRLIDGNGVRPVRGIDIFCNSMAAPGVKAQRWSDHPLLQMGVLDTALEQVALERPGGACQNSSMLLDQARLSNVQPVLLNAPSAREAAMPEAFSESARRQMSADLKGAVLVAIPGKVGAWYRIDLTSGVSLGYVENGGGQALTEHIEDSALVWMVYEYMNIYCEAVQCLGRGFAMAISMDPEGQREQFAVCTCEVALEVATSVSCILKEADPESLLDFGKFFAVSKGWGSVVSKICEKAFEGEGKGHGGEGGGE